MVESMVSSGQVGEEIESCQITKDQVQAYESKEDGHKTCLMVSISDTGIGIDPKYQVNIFQPFEQVDGSASRIYQGTGLGLSLTKKLVELHHGRIWVESEGEGKGTTFTFIVPV